MKDKVYRSDYKCVFLLHTAEADFVCGLARWLGREPDQTLETIIRMWAFEHPDIKDYAWKQAKKDGRGRGTWKKFVRKPPG